MDLYGPTRVSKYLAWSTLASLTLTSFAPTSWFLTLSVAVPASIGALDVAMNGWGAEVERRGVKSIMSSLHAYWSLSAGIGGLVGLTAIKLGFSVEQHFLLVVLIMSGLPGLASRVDWVGSIVKESTPAFALPHQSLWLVGFLMFCAALTGSCSRLGRNIPARETQSHWGDGSEWFCYVQLGHVYGPDAR